jgi:selenide,water dikinase
VPASAPRLTELSHGAGCGCKLPAAQLQPLVRGLAGDGDPRLLVGPGTADDAGVWRLTDEIALVQTVDFFTPIVDDPFDFGRIAAANALSDVYAMGGRPVTALNLVAFSLEALGGDVLREILRGGGKVVAAAGATVVGGHSIDDPEPKYGLAVTGVVHPDRVLSNAGAQPGDELVLTKPLGAGAISTAAKRGLASEEAQRAAVEVMTTLNDRASAAARSAGAHALTDVTGFGLLGHLHELASASGVAAELDGAAVPAIEGSLELLAGDEPAVSGGARRNAEWTETFTSFAGAVPLPRRRLLSDPMTSGGLLAALPADRAHELPGRRIGRLLEGPPGRIRVQ